MAEDCIFCRIIKGEIPSTKVYEDDKMIAINDVAPAAPVHVLLLPKEPKEWPRRVHGPPQPCRRP